MAVWTCKECETPCILETGRNVPDIHPDFCPVWNDKISKWTNREQEDKKHEDLDFIRKQLSRCLRRMD